MPYVKRNSVNKSTGAKAAHQVLVKLAPVRSHYITNSFCANFFRQKLQRQTVCMQRYQMLLKLTPVWLKHIVRPETSEQLLTSCRRRQFQIFQLHSVRQKVRCVLGLSFLVQFVLIIITVKLGYDDHGYKFTAITYKMY